MTKEIISSCHKFTTKYRPCLFTDASDTHWAAVLTQVPAEFQDKSIQEQRHKPLCFPSGSFSGPVANWSIAEKEGISIVQEMCRLDYLIMGHETTIFTDHANLVYLYDPYGNNPYISRQNSAKLMRWAIKLSAFRDVFEHLPGERHVWADILTPWAANPSRHVRASRVMHAMDLMIAPVNPSLDPKLDWPKVSDIMATQDRKSEKPLKCFNKTPEGIRNAQDVPWIPNGAAKMKFRVIIAAHTGHGGHRSANVTLATVRAYFYWKGMESNVKSFVGTFIHCLCTEPAVTITRPLGHTLHAEQPDELVHFDFCYMCPAEKDFLYVFVGKDDHSGYAWLVPSKEITAEVVLDTLITCCAAFGKFKQLVSDRGTHFKNEAVKELKEVTKSAHHFTLAYCPWSNETVEVVNLELLRITRALFSEYQLPISCLPNILPVLQSALNNTRLARLGNRSPLTVFAGHKQDNPLTAATHKAGKQTVVMNMEEVRERQMKNVESKIEALGGMHKEISERTTKKFLQAIKAHNRKKNVRTINFFLTVT